jgi:hypothetical protein
VEEPRLIEVVARCRLSIGKPTPEMGSLSSSPIRLRRILPYGIDGLESSVGGLSQNLETSAAFHRSVLREHRGKRRKRGSAGETATAAPESVRDRTPCFVGRVDDWAAVLGGPATGALVVGVGPTQDLGEGQ